MPLTVYSLITLRTGWFLLRCFHFTHLLYLYVLGSLILFCWFLPLYCGCYLPYGSTLPCLTCLRCLCVRLGVVHSIYLVIALPVFTPFALPRCLVSWLVALPVVAVIWLVIGSFSPLRLRLLPLPTLPLVLTTVPLLRLVQLHTRILPPPPLMVPHTTCYLYHCYAFSHLVPVYMRLVWLVIALLAFPYTYWLIPLVPYLCTVYWLPVYCALRLRDLALYLAFVVTLRSVVLLVGLPRFSRFHALLWFCAVYAVDLRCYLVVLYLTPGLYDYVYPARSVSWFVDLVTRRLPRFTLPLPVLITLYTQYPRLPVIGCLYCICALRFGLLLPAVVIRSLFVPVPHLAPLPCRSRC